MSEQLTEQTNSIIAEMGETLTAIFDETFAALIERRDSQYAAAIAPLDAERESLMQEHAAIEEAARSLELLLPAKARLAQHEADQLAVAGKSEEAQAKLREMRQAENAPVAMKQQQAEITARIEKIEEEKRKAARRVFREWLPDCHRVIRRAEAGLFIVLLDGLQKSFWDFQTLTGTNPQSVGDPDLFTAGDLTALTADERSQEWNSGTRWYSGRGR